MQKRFAKGTMAKPSRVSERTGQTALLKGTGRSYSHIGHIHLITLELTQEMKTQKKVFLFFWRIPSMEEKTKNQFLLSLYMAQRNQASKKA